MASKEVHSSVSGACTRLGTCQSFRYIALVSQSGLKGVFLFKAFSSGWFDSGNEQAANFAVSCETAEFGTCLESFAWVGLSDSLNS